jgi:ABC-type multidrug transport system fused ATPase/permease subunit
MGLIIVFAVSCFVRESTIFSIVLSITTNMYHRMSEKVLRSNILFFDSNPIGRILTRFSKDMAVMDLIVPSLSILMSYGIFRAIAVTICIICVNYWMLIPIAISLSYLIYLVTRA